MRGEVYRPWVLRHRVPAIGELARLLFVAIDIHRELPDLGDGCDAVALVDGELRLAGALAPRQRRARHDAVGEAGVVRGDSFRQALERGKREASLDAIGHRKWRALGNLEPERVSEAGCSRVHHFFLSPYEIGRAHV